MAKVLGSRGLMLDPVCKICNRENETIEHLFKSRDFPTVFGSNYKLLSALGTLLASLLMNGWKLIAGTP